MENTKKNPKEECKAVMTRSKRFVENEEEKSVGLKKKAVEEKGIDGRKNDVRGENNQENGMEVCWESSELTKIILRRGREKVL